jgi:ABC-type branched-subunit amino acid transport system ATPase component
MSAASTKGSLGGLSQERIVLGLSAVLFVLFSIFVSGFLTASNVLSLIQNVAILGLLGSGMAITIIGRGIDLSMVAIMAISVAWSLALFNGGMGATPALLLGFGFALLIGLINGILIAYVEIPAIFTTLAMGTVVYGFGQFLLVPIDVTYVNESIGWIHQLGSGQTLGIPNSVISFAVLAAIAHFVLRATTFDRVRYSVPRQAVRDGIVYVTEDRKIEGFFDNMSIAENLHTAFLTAGQGKGFVLRMNEMRELARYWTKALNVKAINENARVVELSGGNQQKVVIAKALVQKPQLIIFDEPTRGVDVGAISEIHQLIGRLADEGLGVLLISSYLPEILNVSDRVLVSQNGRIVEEFTPEEATEERIRYAAVH